MERIPRKIYTCEFKLEAAWLVESGQSIAGAAHSLNIPEQTLWRWVRDQKAGKLKSSGRGSRLTTGRWRSGNCGRIWRGSRWRVTLSTPRTGLRPWGGVRQPGLRHGHEVMKMCGLIASMSRGADCWDNAVTETLFGSLKVERLHGEKFLTVRAAKDAVMHWILWHNRDRMHSVLGHRSPVEFGQTRQLQREAA